MIELTTAGWAILLAGALLVGVAKTALPGSATLTVALYAAVLPARESTAVLLILLITGDLMAIWIYRKDADWAILRKLMAPVVIGLGAGAAFLWIVDDTTMRRSIGAILLILTGVTLLMMWRGKLDADSTLTNPGIRGVYGFLGGFTTMTANAGGPVMTLYFVAARFDVKRFLATQAWFFFAVNVTKVPIHVGLGLLRVEHAPLLATLAPVVIVGALFGRVLVRHMDQALFTRVVLALTVVSSLYLLR